MKGPSPPTLYHYTSSRTFLSILENRCLWLSGRWNLNDSNEGAVFSTHLRAFAKKESIAEPTIERVIADLSSLESYMSCFSTAGDLLSQWRGYADNGSGVSIGFSRAALIDLIKGDSRCLLRPVTYADSVEDLDPATQDLMIALLRSRGNPRDNFLQSAAKTMWEIKNSAFREEAEFRLILTPSDSHEGELSLSSGANLRRKYRAVEAGIREHWELELARLSELVTEVVLGPKCDSHESVVRRLLFALGLTDVRITRSSVTYR